MNEEQMWLVDQLEIGFGTADATASTSDEGWAQILAKLKRVWIAELVAEDDDDPHVDDVEKDLAQNVVHLELFHAPFSGALQLTGVRCFVNDCPWSRRSCMYSTPVWNSHLLFYLSDHSKTWSERPSWLNRTQPDLYYSSVQFRNL